MRRATRVETNSYQATKPAYHPPPAAGCPCPWHPHSAGAPRDNPVQLSSSTHSWMPGAGCPRRPPPPAAKPAGRPSRQGPPPRPRQRAAAPAARGGAPWGLPRTRRAAPAPHLAVDAGDLSSCRASRVKYGRGLRGLRRYYQVLPRFMHSPMYRGTFYAVGVVELEGRGSSRSRTTGVWLL